jgi:hypothetical protein
MVYLRKSNGLNLDVNALGKSLDSNAAASRLVGEPLLVLGVHIGKVVHVGQEDIDLDDLGDVGASGLNNGLEVLAALSSLLADSALDEGQIRGDGDLARAVDGRWGLDGLRVGSQSGRGIGGGNNLRHCGIESLASWKVACESCWS